MATSLVKLVSAFVCFTEEKLGKENVCFILSDEPPQIGHLTGSKEHEEAMPAQFLKLYMWHVCL